ncbi:acetyl-CoA carboxylase biotin carboxylase subunit [bacterium]|nr:acetyl-CoA carboxylase biotin carboxylase subunit [bacterium]
MTRVLIANRGEIAVRIIRACRELGIASVAVYSEPDARALHVRLADQARLIGPAPPRESYLRADKLLAVAAETGCDAVHPGYGFLSENDAFAQAVNDAGLAWIGPPPPAIRGMGLKVESRATAIAAGVPVVPGFELPSEHGLSDSEADLRLAEAAMAIGYPVLVKASAGGGGKGMRLVEDPERLDEALAAARREAQAAFGNPTVYLEKYIRNPRHIEIQLLADKHGNIVHLGERECSIQRRYQKIIEEAPSPAVSAELREKMGSGAVALARAVGYEGAGTVEFIVGQDALGQHYYFLEMNTRLQVEHPVTELAYGLDLLHWQLRIAAGEELTLRQEDLKPRGHAIECRLCAEDPAAGFLPQVGRIGVYREPQSPGVRVDTALYEGWEVGADYDPLLAKLIVHGPDRDTAIQRAAQALRDYAVLGLTTNSEYLQAILAHPAFLAGELSTGFITQHMEGWAPAPATELHWAAAAVAAAVPRGTAQQASSAASTALHNPWQSLGAWSNV